MIVTYSSMTIIDNQAGEIVQLINILAVKPEDLSITPRTHTEEGEHVLSQVDLCTHFAAYTPLHIHAYIH